MALLTVPALGAGDDLPGLITPLVANQNLVLRHVYRGDELQFAADGTVVGSPEPGTWAADSTFHVNHVSVEGRTVRLKGERRLMFYDHQGALQAMAEGSSLTVRLQVPADANSEPSIADALARVFFKSTDHAYPAAPPLRQELRPAKYEMREAGKGHYEFRLNGTAEWKPQASIDEPIVIGQLPNGQNLYIVTRAVTPPKATSATDPPFPSAARAEGIDDGMTQLAIVVDSSGNVAATRIAVLGGHGFDEEAVRAVSRWKFEPARANGQPVAVWLIVELNFHLG